MRILGIPIPAIFPEPRSVRDANMASIHAIPRALLPDGPARSFLMTEANAGKDVYAYAPTQLPSEHERRWNVWYGPLAPRYDARIPAQTWATHWPDLVTKAAAAREITQANGRA